MTLGDIISQYRREHAMSMDKFSKMSGISKAYISMLEKNRTQRGEEPAPSIEMYRNVADAIGVDVDELVRMVDGKVLLSKKLPSNCLPLPQTVKKPRLGAIACGKPILAVENISASTTIRNSSCRPGNFRFSSVKAAREAISRCSPVATAVTKIVLKI